MPRTRTRSLRTRRTLRTGKLGHKPFGRWGRPLRRRAPGRLAQRLRGRDKTRASSDAVWALVEQLMGGDESVLPVIDDAIEEGVSAGKTVFMKLPSDGRDTHNYAAVTPGRQIVLFGVKPRYDQATGTYPRRGYVSRYKIGDEAVHGSYNLVYTGPITSITAKRVMINASDIGRGKRSLTIEGFSNKNWKPDTIADATKQNRNWMD